MNLLRIWAIAANGFREVIRDRILYLIGFFALLLAIAMLLLPEVALNADKKIFLDLGLAAISFLSAIVAIFVGTGLINKEIEKRTVLVLIPKPISRAELIIGKHLGLSAVITVLVVSMTVVFLLLLGISKNFYPIGAILVTLISLLIELSLLVSVAIVFGVFTSSILGTLLTFGVYLMGHSSQDLVKLGAISKNQSIEFITKTLYILLPDLSRFDLKNEAVYGIIPGASTILNNALYGLVYMVLLLSIAVLIFSRREF